MKEVYEGYLREVDTATGARLFLNIGDVVVPVEKMFEGFPPVHKLRVTIEDIREQKERQGDYVASLSAVRLKDIVMVPQAALV